MIEELDRFTIGARRQDGRRDQLLPLHAMARSVIRGAGLSAPASVSLPEAAGDLASELEEAIEMLQRRVRPLEVLRDLASRD